MIGMSSERRVHPVWKEKGTLSRQLHLLGRIKDFKELSITYGGVVDQRYDELIKESIASGIPIDVTPLTFVHKGATREGALELREHEVPPKSISETGTSKWDRIVVGTLYALLSHTWDMWVLVNTPGELFTREGASRCGNVTPEQLALKRMLFQQEMQRRGDASAIKFLHRINAFGYETPFCGYIAVNINSKKLERPHVKVRNAAACHMNTVDLPKSMTLAALCYDPDEHTIIMIRCEEMKKTSVFVVAKDAIFIHEGKAIKNTQPTSVPVTLA